MSNDNVIEFPKDRARAARRHVHRNRRGGVHPPARAPGPARDAALLAAVLMMLGATESREEIPRLAARFNAEIEPETLRAVLIEASGRIGDIVCLCLEEAAPEGSG